MHEKDAKIVVKPWGREVWLRVPTEEEMLTGRGYCLKIIHLNRGEKSSLQYHERKSETQYIIEGQAEIWLEDDIGKIKKSIMGPGEFFNVSTGKTHRVIALTDLVLAEASTPEINDVVRVHDDYGRGS